MIDKPLNNEAIIEKSLEERYQTIVDTFVDSDHLSKDEFFKKVFESVFELIPEAEKGSYYELVDGFFHPIQSRGYDVDILSQLEFTLENVFIGFEVDEKESIEVYEFHNKRRDDSKFTKKEIEIFKALGTYEEFTSLYSPIQINGETVGMLCFERFDGKFYNQSAKLLLKLYVKLISNFYSQIVRREKLSHQYEEIINTMVSAIEVKDKYTEGHGKRVTQLAVGLAKHMGISGARTEVLRTAAMLHDVGKIGIHSQILTKPGKLTEEEYEIIKEHPVHTKKILSNITDFSEVVDVAYKHHEFYNGNGYPLGLAGDEIPIEAAILSLADAFDAMTADRSYRKAMSEDKALAIIAEERGRQFHPLVVDKFIDWHRNVK